MNPNKSELIRALGLDFSAEGKGIFRGLEAIAFYHTTQVGGNIPITTTWSQRGDDLGGASVVTESSGTFSFGSTGLWEIFYRCAIWVNQSTQETGIVYVRTCEDYTTGPTWSNTVQMRYSGFETYRDEYGNVSGTLLKEITDVSEQKIQVRTGTAGLGGTVNFGGGSLCELQFTKLADL